MMLCSTVPVAAYFGCYYIFNFIALYINSIILLYNFLDDHMFEKEWGE